MSEEVNLYSSNEKKYVPFGKFIDDYIKSCKPEDDIEYAIGKMIQSSIKFFVNYRRMRKHKRFKAKLKMKKTDELNTQTLKIRDRTCTFRAVVQILVEQTAIN